MLISDFVQIPLPMAEVVERLTGALRDRLDDDAAGAEADVRHLRVSVGPEIAGHRPLAKTVAVELGQPRARDERLMLTIRWVSIGPASSIFPVLEGDLELARLGDRATQITLFGRYEPPLHELGRRVDRLLLHRVAQATIRAFLRRLGDRVCGDAHASSPTPGGVTSGRTG